MNDRYPIHAAGAKPHCRKSAFLKVFRRGPQRDGRHGVTAVHVDKPRKDEAAGVRRCLWRKSAEGVVHMADKRAPEFGAPGESLTFAASCRCFEPRKRATVCRI